jgi:hypothetical protein
LRFFGQQENLEKVAEEYPRASSIIHSNPELVVILRLTATIHGDKYDALNLKH